MTSARDLLNQLTARLDDRTQNILHMLVQGHGIREIAGRTGICPAMVIKHREKIIGAARRLGVQRQS